MGWIYRRCVVLSAATLFFAACAAAQVTAGRLDPSREAALTPAGDQRQLPEEYIWTAGDVTAKRPDRSKFSWARTDLRAEPHLFRAHFRLARIPQSGTLYIAGCRSARVFLNGSLLREFSTDTDQPINFRVFHADASRLLRKGDNVIAIEAVRGRGVVTGSAPATTQQLAYGEVLVAKILAGRFGDEQAPALVVSSTKWRSVRGPAAEGWRDSGFDDTEWPQVESLGLIESNLDFMQWSADAGMYGWPGYRGMSPWLRTLLLAPAQLSHLYSGTGSFHHLEGLTSNASGAAFSIALPRPPATDAEAPSLLLDFGREISGRVVFQSDSAEDAEVSVAYGESELEALATGITPTQRGGNYLGTNLLEIPAHGFARGPKSAFRYVRVRFLRGSASANFTSIRAEAIIYPVNYEGAFESSDPLLNRIWESAAYTAHLCMQDDIWDAPKRDRGRWAGDLDVESRTILTAFGDKFLLEDTLRRLAEGTAPGQPVNGIAGYTAQWITTLATLFEHSGDHAFVASQHAAVLRFLQTMDEDLDPVTGLLKANARGWGFVDWAPGLYGNTRDVEVGTTLEFLRAYQVAPALLRASGDEEAARRYEAKSERLRNAARAAYLSSATGTLGDTWQLNALAVLSGLSEAGDSDIWTHVLAHVKQDAPTDQVISPYFNTYVLDAMARSGHQRAALDWMRQYWGGMLNEGATSFWEAYDLRWPKTNFHLSLQADGTSGYFVSLAHGWSSGPLAWLSENVLGVRATAPGYDSVDIHPNLMGMSFARGSVATPHGPIRVSLDTTQGLVVDLPSGVESARIYVPEKAEGSATAPGSAAAPVLVNHSGRYEFAAQ